MAKLLGVSPSTLRRLEENGEVKGYGIKVIYTPSGHRRYVVDEVAYLYSQRGFSGKLGFGNKPALLIRDLTVAFTDPNSKLSFNLKNQIESTIQIIEEVKKHQLPIIFSRTIYDSNNPFSQMWGKKFPSLQVLDESSTWVAIHDKLSKYSFDLINSTPYITDLYQSSVEKLLLENDVDTLILAGATTSGSIRATAIEAFQKGYHVVIPREAVGDRSEAIEHVALLDLNSRYADVVDITEVLDYVKSL